MEWLEFFRRNSAGHYPDAFNFGDTAKLKHVGDPGLPGDESSSEEDLWLWRPGKPKADEFNFAPFYPVDNGGTPPYHKQIHQVPTEVAGQFFRWRAKARKQHWDVDLDAFVAPPLPSPEDLGEDDED